MSIHLFNVRTPSRRRFLKSTGVGLLAAPFFRILEARAQPPIAKRFITIATPLGHHNAWLPEGTGDTFSFGSAGAPLQPFKSKLAYVLGTRSALTHIYGGSGAHKAGFPAAFSGDVIKGDGSANAPARNASIDQYVVDAWNPPTPVKSLQLSVLGGGDLQSIISYSGPGAENKLNPQSNARVAFDTLFSGIVGDDSAELARLRHRRESVMDLWTDELEHLRLELGQEHQAPLEAHLSQVRALEQLLGAPNGGACEPPEAITNGNGFYGDASKAPEISAQMINLIVAAMSCDISRVTSLAFHRAGSNLKLPWATGNNKSHHSLTHDTNSGGTLESLRKIDLWYTSQVALLLEKLDSIPEGDGTMLDNTLIYWGTELGKINTHSGFNMPLLLAGNSDGYFRTGYVHRFPGNNNQQVPLNDLLAELATGLGVPTQIFGNANFATGPMPELRA